MCLLKEWESHETVRHAVHADRAEAERTTWYRTARHRSGERDQDERA